MVDKSILYRDVRFNFIKDDPFPDDPGRAKCKQLIDYMDKNASAFNDKKDSTGISFLYINPNIDQLFGESISENNKFRNPIINKMKYFIANSAVLGKSIKDKFLRIAEYVPRPKIEKENKTKINQIEQNPDENNSEEEENNENQNSVEENNFPDGGNNFPDDDFGEIPPLSPEKFSYSRTAGLTNYDITTNKPISYSDLRLLTVNIARSELAPIVNNEGYKLKLEEQKRLELQDAIKQYRQIREIGALTQDDISTMNITQLTELVREYKKAYDNKKLYTVFKKSGNIIGTITSTVFPNGIRIGRNEETGDERYIQMKGVIKEITNQIFDNSSVQGYAFGNLLKKSNINISDSVLAVISIAETLISNIQVVEVPSGGRKNDQTSIPINGKINPGLMENVMGNKNNSPSIPSAISPNKNEQEQNNIDEEYEYETYSGEEEISDGEN